jgi:arylformamidase
MTEFFEIIDISQPISQSTACFPGDTPFSSEVLVTYQDSEFMNLSAFTMSPHVGTHADAPVHIQGDMTQPDGNHKTAGQLPLSPFIGPATVINIAPWDHAITWPQIEAPLMALPEFPKRILFKTKTISQSHVFEECYAWLSPDLIQILAERGVTLVGLDTPSVDAVDSKSLETHHALLSGGLCWLENLDLSAIQIPLGTTSPSYFLVALPLKLMELEASPVRAVLLK